MNELQNNLFQTIDTIIQERLNEIAFDKTEICKIISQDVNDPLCYWVTNNNSLKFEAYSNNVEEYKENDMVYVTIPQGNYETKKIILGSYGSNKNTTSVSLENPFQNLISCNSFTIKEGFGFEDIPTNNTYVSKIFEPIKFNKTGYGNFERIGIEFSITSRSITNTGEFQILLDFLDSTGKSLFPTEKDNYLVFSSKQLYGNPYYLTEELDFKYLFSFPSILLEDNRFNSIDKIEIKFIHREGFETLFLNKFNLYFGYDGTVSEEVRINLVSPNVNRDVNESYKTIYDEGNKTELKVLNLEWFKNNRVYNQGPQIEASYEELEDYDIYWLQYCPTIAYTKMLETNQEKVKECYRATLEEYKSALTDKFENLGEGVGQDTALYNRYIELYNQNQTAFDLNVENTLIDIVESGTYWQTIKKAKATELINYYFEFRPSEHFSQYKASREEGSDYVYKDSDKQFEFLDQAEEQIKVIIKNRETGEWIETNGFLFKNINYIPNYGSVSNIDIEFALSDTNSDLPADAEWSTTVPEKQGEFKYIWQRQKISYVGKQDEYSNAVCITGEDGLEGKTIEKVYELYYLWDGKEETDPSRLAVGNTSLQDITDKIADFGASSEEDYDPNGQPYNAPNKWLSTRCPTWLANHNYYTSTLFVYNDQSYFLTPISSLGGLDSANQNSSFDNMVTRIDTLFKLSLSNNEIIQDENWGDPKNWDWATALPEVYPDTTDNLYIWTKQAYFKGSSTEPSYYSEAVCITGNDGSVGKTSYIHIAYANSADGEKDFDTSSSMNKSYIGQYTDFKEEDSQNWKDYSWSQFKGDSGSPGKDGTATEYIYFLHDRAYQWAGWDGNKKDYTQLPTPYGSSNKWTPSPSGISIDWQYEYVSVRISSYDGDTKTWSSWSKPVIWSKWGDKGQDGDGIKYVYYLSANLETLNQPIWPVEKNPTTITPDIWTDEPQGISSIYKYEYVSQFKTPASNGDKGTTPVLWNQWVDSLIAKYIKAKSIPNTPNIGEEAAAGWVDIVPSNLEADERIYMIQRYTQDEVWSNPIQISGLDGEAGADAMDIEFAYYCTEEAKDWPSWDGKEIEIKENSGTEAWYDNPHGVTETYKYEYMTTRTRTGTSEGGWGSFDNSDTSIQPSNWSDWSKPVIWSKWGEKGIDGDGIQYVYYSSDSATPPKNSPSYEGWREENWHDEPQGVSKDNPYEYVSQFICTNGVWSTVGTEPKLWATYSAKLLILYYIIKADSENKNAPNTPDVGNEGDNWKTSYDDTSMDIIQVYMIQRYETDNTWSSPLPLVGVDGDIGMPGYSLVSMLELYYLKVKDNVNDNNSPAPPSNQEYKDDITEINAWNKQCPTWQPNGVYYVCEEICTGIPLVDENGNVQYDGNKIIFDENTYQISYTEVRKIEGLTSANEAANAAQQAINNINKNTVKSVDIYFARSNSKDTLDNQTAYLENGKIVWVTNIADLEDEATSYPYIWMQQRMQMNDNNTTKNSPPVCIGGKDGEDGKTIVDMVELYYLKSDASNEVPDPNTNEESWYTYSPQWVPGGIYYTCIKIIYSDDTYCFTQVETADALNLISQSGLAKELKLTLGDTGIYNYYNEDGTLYPGAPITKTISVEFNGSRKTNNETSGWNKSSEKFIYEITWQIPKFGSMIKPSTTGVWETEDDWDYYEYTYQMDKNNPDTTRIINFDLDERFGYNKTNNIIYCQIIEYKIVESQIQIQKIFVGEYNNFSFGFRASAGTEWNFNIIGDYPNVIYDPINERWVRNTLNLTATLSNLNGETILPENWVNNVIWDWVYEDIDIKYVISNDTENSSSSITYVCQEVQSNSQIMPNQKYLVKDIYIDKQTGVLNIVLKDYINNFTIQQNVAIARVSVSNVSQAIEKTAKEELVTELSSSIVSFKNLGENSSTTSISGKIQIEKYDIIAGEKVKVNTNFSGYEEALTVVPIVKATLQDLETPMGKINLIAYYPIAYSWGDYKLNGPTMVAYNNEGINPQYDKTKFQFEGQGTGTNQNLIFHFYTLEHHESYDFLVTKDKQLLPPQFIPNNCAIILEIWDKEWYDFVWIQPLVIYRNRFENETLNSWNGSQVIDKENNAILSAFFAAGTKEKDNSFTGVLIGQIGDKNSSKSGIYGLQKGNLRFKFNEDGSLFIGASEDNYISFNEQAEGRSSRNELRVKGNITNQKDINYYYESPDGSISATAIGTDIVFSGTEEIENEIITGIKVKHDKFVNTYGDSVNDLNFLKNEIVLGLKSTKIEDNLYGPGYGGLYSQGEVFWIDGSYVNSNNNEYSQVFLTANAFGNNKQDYPYIKLEDHGRKAAAIIKIGAETADDFKTYIELTHYAGYNGSQNGEITLQGRTINFITGMG